MSLLAIGSSANSNPRLILATGVQVKVVLVLLVLKTVEVTEIKDVTDFFAATVTVGPAGIVVS